MIGGVVVRRDRGRRARHPVRAGRGRGHLPGPLLPGGQEGAGEATGRAGQPPPHRGPDGGRRGDQGAGRLPGHGGARRGSPSATWPPWRTSTRPRSAPSTNPSRLPPKTPSPAWRRRSENVGFSHWLRQNSEHYLLVDAQRRIAVHGRPPAAPTAERLPRPVLAGGLFRPDLPAAALEAAAGMTIQLDAGQPPPDLDPAAGAGDPRGRSSRHQAPPRSKDNEPESRGE